MKEELKQAIDGARTTFYCKLINLKPIDIFSKVQEVYEHALDLALKQIEANETLKAENETLKTTIKTFATGVCSAHQIPNAECRICNPAIDLTAENERLKGAMEKAIDDLVSGRYAPYIRIVAEQILTKALNRKK